MAEHGIWVELQEVLEAFTKWLHSKPWPKPRPRPTNYLDQDPLDDEDEPSWPGFGRRMSSWPPKPIKHTDIGYEGPKTNNKLKTSKEIKAKCE